VIVAPDIHAAEDAVAFAVLLHPHPSYGGNRFHPFIDALFDRLPTISVSAIRFDSPSAVDAAADRWPHRPGILVGYSFGAGIAASIDDERVGAWYLLAPPLVMLADATIGDVSRPKVLVIPEHDQFSPPAAVIDAVAGWQATTVTTMPDADHFLGVVEPFVVSALTWIEQVTAS
jgi:uncharacterized protein